MALLEMKVKFDSTTALLMHAPTTVDTLSAEAKAMKAITEKKNNKTDSDQRELRRIDWHAGIYHDESLGPVIPAENIERCIEKAGTTTKNGKNVQRAFLLAPEFDLVPLLYSGPRDLKGLWGDGESEFVDLRGVKVSQARNIRCRPRFNQWALEFTATLDDEVMSADVFERILTSAGRTTGLGDFRPRFGRFDAQVAFS